RGCARKWTVASTVPSSTPSAAPATVSASIRRLVGTTAFRQALIYVGLLLASLGLALGGVKIIAERSIHLESASAIAAEIDGLAAIYRQQGLRALVQEIERRSSQPYRGAIYLVLDEAGERLAGNLAGWSDPPAVQEDAITFSVEPPGDTQVRAEARTFGLEGLFRQVGIYDPAGQLYEPVDADQVAWYKQAANGQVLQEGINEAGSMSSWLAAATAYANYGEAMVPFYIYYSMFGYQRIGDLAWLAGDIRARGFLIGATAGRTTLEGEGLQHNDGHNIMMFSAVPSCRVYDPTYGYEMAIIIRDGLKAMVEEKRDCYYYITAMNENYSHPAMPEDVEEGVLKGAYRLRESKKKLKNRVQLMGSGTILREAEAAAVMLEDEWKVAADVWSATSFTELAREGQACERHNRLHPDADPKTPYITTALAEREAPVIAATDYIQAYPDQIRRFVPASYTTLGTDGYGRSDTRAALRRFFEVDAAHIVVAALKALADEGSIPAAKVNEAIKKYDIDPDCAPPIER
ncbi:MAG: transketolase-like TK C-terminal-containing protein, partial [Guyparkeria sp.]